MTAEFANQMKHLFSMLDMPILLHFFHLKSMLPNNLNRICVRILALLLAFPISVLLTSSSFTSSETSSDFIWVEKIKKALNPSRMFDTIFLSAFLSSLYFKHSFDNNPFLEYLGSLANFPFFSMSSAALEWWCAYSTLPLMIVAMTE